MQETKTDQCPYCNQAITHAEYERIAKRIQDELDVKMKSIEAEANAKLQTEQKRLDEGKKALEIAKLEAAQLQKGLEEEKQSFKQKMQKEADDRLSREVENLRKSFESKEKDLIEEGKKVARLEGDTDKRNLQRRIEDLSRQLERKTAEELGSVSEEELVKRLAEVFREDKITRIPKGEQGADVHHEIFHKGLRCGLIIYESKNRKDWQNAYIERAKEYKTMYKTPSIILVSITFPKGTENFCIREGIVIVHPSIVVPIAEIIRGTILKLHLMNLTQQEATSKMNEVYKFISGDDFKVQIDSIVQSISDLQKTQQKEKDEHNRVWSKQSTLFDSLQRSAFTIKSKIDNIIHRTD